MSIVLITGGSGLIGKQLTKMLIDKGHEVRWLSRKTNNSIRVNVFLWDIQKGFIDENAFENVEYIFHLAGAGIADKKWSKKAKEQIINSRVESSKLLLNYIDKYQPPLKAFISSSAIGYYGAITTNKIFTENDDPHNDFLSRVCQLWENYVLLFRKNNIRTTILRVGIVLSNRGGALTKMKTPIITPLGNGKQWMPWIHIEDLCRMFIHAMDKKSVSGIFNAVSPEYQTNKSFSKLLAKSIRRPFINFGIPSFILKLFLGEMSKIILYGSRVSSKKIVKIGFEFNYPELNKALTHLYPQKS